MKGIKKISLFLSVMFFAFLFVYQPVLLRGQSIEDLQNIQEGIGGGNGEVAESDSGGDNYVVYVVLGAMVIGVGLYYYLKWAEKKRPSHKTKNDEKKVKTFDKNSNGKTEKVENLPDVQQNILPEN